MPGSVITGPSMGVPGTMGLPVVRGFPAIAPLQNFLLTGTTRDASGNPLGACTVHLFQTNGDVNTGITVSDANGIFRFFVGPLTTYYLVAYLPGSPDVAGTTVNTLTGV